MSNFLMPEYLRCALELRGYEVRSGTSEDDMLGSGGYGNVWRARQASNGAPVAIKVIEESSENLKMLQREIGNQKCLNHPNVVQLLEVVGVLQYVCLVLELADKGSVWSHVKAHRRLEEAEALHIFRQLIRAVEYIHFKGVYSRDIKPDNVLMSAGSGEQPPLIKLCDFGLSKNAFLLEKNHCGEKLDVWGCGVVLYYMLSGRFPYQRPQQQGMDQGRNKHHDLMKRIVNEPPSPLPEGIAVSEECLELIKGLLRKDPKTRLSIVEIQEHRVFHRDLQGGLAAWKEDSKRLQLSDTYQGADLAAEAEQEVEKALLHIDQDTGENVEIVSPASSDDGPESLHLGLLIT